ncbi:DUF3667 domain-containing protein [Massilia sp. G4R7]|uniref:DUF3667 domain-containing protein n=1 Tax=Massilia phyllostachyos TaxID=2898585 RepID=A0ABS8Q008_9BURK|nr:DUF3667 domain-containing protein [Massilia phyllostachyos]MCD2514863.1 DUF3667 domain-containing protein [Massilia phyllostachyos]
MMASPSRPDRIVTTDALIEHQHLENCRNCGAITQGNFCQQCGQATHLHVPSAREFLHEFVAHYVALEGKLWHSLKLLIFKPGLLTREYIEGRRVRYVEPLRLYLSFSIIFFFVIKMSGVEIINLGESERSPQAERAQAALTAPATAPDKAKPGKIESKQIEVQAFGEYSKSLSDRINKVLSLPRDQLKDLAKRTFFSYVPYAIFLMMPVFALYLKLLYLGSGRRYGEHFLFALHSNAFAFLMLSLFVVADGWNFVRFVLLAWLTFYLPTALRRVYGGGRTVTALRWAVLMFLHVITMGIAMTAAISMILL